MKAISVCALIPRPALRRPALRGYRRYAVQSPGAPTIEVFNNHTKWLQKERAAKDAEKSRQVDYLRDEVASRLCERLLDIKRNFPCVLDLGANACNIAYSLSKPNPYQAEDDLPLSTRIENLTCAESSETLLNRDVSLPFNDALSITRDVLPSLESLPYEPNAFDAVLSSLSLHWINDLPSVLAQINTVLKPDGPFLGVMFGGDTLFELRTSLQLAELDRRGGVSTHTSPLANVSDVGGLLQRAGFKLLTVDVDDIIIDYPNSFALMQDLQAMGESNAVLGREAAGIRRDVLAAADAIYRELHGNQDGSVPATFRLIYMIGWKESPNQAKPLSRGSGMVSIKDVLEGKGDKGGKEGDS
ncbi:S-adenosyl-L-methionine-dependent methyltransferase [Trichodelitschia bisporula]|uniref:S-adenosyl-L-methionine-dependent methyltransferase n=1 Tax=Trichodelitschia bisporula TaxID=703511 RepID=A0A6G1HWH9_9PEZI|nr:S-adenosyl-L-methionine-dependent methyltransferase [Trichodelitschia bisporula]